MVSYPVGVHIRVTLVGVLAAENITSSYSTLLKGRNRDR